MASRERGRGYWVRLLRLLLRLINTLLALVGLAMIGYSVYMFIKFKHTEFHPSNEQLMAAPPPPPGPHSRKAGFPWFIVGFGGMGALTFLTAWCGLLGVSYNNRSCLSIYSCLLGLLLLVQVTLAVAFFADDSWKKKLPHDDTGQAAAMEKFIRRKLAVCKWVGLGALAVQVVSMFLAFQLSSAQMHELDASSDDEEEVWGRRRPLMSQRTSSAAAESSSQSPMPGTTSPGGRREDPWSVRMRDKYGLDTAQFGYNPESEANTGRQVEAQPPAQPDEERGSRCSIM
ncbi:hypothetical protein WJX73_008891 [Symbiochloris irregularis]|uniref:Tetraspanin n=1 Tax=Symbiochloris irregularis TaxID=706552 RepID=A0AAW1NLH7_9CHLO